MRRETRSSSLSWGNHGGSQENSQGNYDTRLNSLPQLSWDVTWWVHRLPVMEVDAVFCLTEVICPQQWEQWLRLPPLRADVMSCWYYYHLFDNIFSLGAWRSYLLFPPISSPWPILMTKYAKRNRKIIILKKNFSAEEDSGRASWKVQIYQWIWKEGTFVIEPCRRGSTTTIKAQTDGGKCTLSHVTNPDKGEHMEMKGAQTPGVPASSRQAQPAQVRPSSKHVKCVYTTSGIVLGF